MAERAKPAVALLAAAETSPSVLYGLYDVLYSVGSAFPDLTLGEPTEDALDVQIVAAGSEPFRCAGNIVVEPHAGIAEIDSVDVVVVCDMYTPTTTPPRGKYLSEIAWLKKMHRAGALVCAVCSGSVVLAESGLLDGYEAASHWAYADLFRSCYPAVTMRPDAILCRHGEADNLITAGGVTAWHDLSLYLISRLCGHKQAVETAKVFLISGHESGQLPYAVMGKTATHSDAVIGHCQAWIAENYAETNPVQRMTELSGLTSRTFARRFQVATGFRPIDYIQMLRVEEAKQILEMESTGVDEIAEAVGYKDPVSFRRVFKRIAGLTPAAYRRKFQRYS